jgi:decaprenylphospho-beta-D-ribofuranose 2-oxidase
MSKKILILPTTLLIIVVLTKFLIWEDTSHQWLIKDIYYHPNNDQKLTVAPDVVLANSDLGNSAWLDDASKLNPTLASDFVIVKNKKDIVESISKAKTQKKSISLSGARHSMGGQNLGSSIHLDMLGYDKVINYSQDDTSVTVESGITWKQLQEFLEKKDRAVAVMQDSNIFTIGGSMGSNVHGKDVRYKSLIQTINWFKMIGSDGAEKTYSRSENYEIFKSAIGGMGLFGIITEVNLKTEPNVNYQYTITHQDASLLVSKFDEYIANGAEQVEGHFSVSKDKLLQDLQIYYFQKTDKQSKDDVSGENNIWLRKLTYRLSRNSDWGKQFRWWMQTFVSPIVDPGYSTRNGSMSAPFRVLQLEDRETTDILQEYFVPRNQVQPFLEKYRELLRKNDINLINCGLRKVLPDNEATVSYATEEMYGFVCYYKIFKDDTKNTIFKEFTGKIMNLLIETDSKYYLAYNPLGYNKEILQMYPNISKLLELKKQTDPDNIFNNKWLQNLQK